MSTEETYNTTNKYYIVHDGIFKVQVPENHPEAVRRDWETPDGRSGTKYERHVAALIGKIQHMSIKEGTYGKTMNIYLDENNDGDTPVISMGVTSRFGEDILKRLPSVDFDKHVRLFPFAFIPEGEEKEKRGVAITQKDEEGKFTVKIGNFFYDEEAKKYTNGYPEPTDEDKEDWAFFYKKANKFMVKYVEENVLPRFSEKQTKKVDYPTEEVKPDDIPF